MQIKHKYELQPKQAEIISSFPAMKGFTPLKVRNDRVFTQMLQKKSKGEHNIKQKQMEYLEKMKKARQLILSHHRKNKYSESLSASRKNRTEGDDLTISLVDVTISNRQSVGYYRICHSLEYNQSTSKHSNKNKQEELRVCQSDFNPNKYQKKAYLFNKIATQLCLQNDNNAYSAPTHQNSYHTKQFLCYHQKPQQNNTRQQSTNINTDHLKYNQEIKGYALPCIKNYDDRLMSIKIQKNLKLYQRGGSKFLHNKKLCDSHEQQQEKQQIEKEGILTLQKKTLNKRAKRKNFEHENVLSKKSKRGKKMEDLDFNVEGWKAEESGSVYLC